ncbi:MAG: hypothetical protein KIS92_02010 [Planctomycetota bacterium]|nr:hypothetical protein [Planctomycetota bacterium]
MKTAIGGPDVVQPTGAYSAGVRAGDFIYVAGQGPLDPATGEIVGADIEAQTRKTLENVRAVLRAAGAEMDACVSVTVHLADIGEFERFNLVYETFFADPKPARITVASGLEGIRVEIGAVAYSPMRRAEQETPGVLARLGVRPLVNAMGSYTKYGGQLLAPEALQAMNEAAACSLDLLDLQRKAGAYIARRLGVEAAFVSSGAAGGLFVAMAACLAGTDVERIERLPRTDGPNECIVLRAHREYYHQGLRAAGATVIEVGGEDGASLDELRRALNDRTAALVYYASHERKGRIALEDFVACARALGERLGRRIPVIVDSAAEIPPVENLTLPLQRGADLNVVSGGKQLRGPQGSGLVLGLRGLIEACIANGSPNDAIGRPCKVTKEEIAGLVAALDRFLALDHAAEWRSWEARCARIERALAGVPGLRARAGQVGEEEHFRPILPCVRIAWDREACAKSPEAAWAELTHGDPAVLLRLAGDALVYSPQVLPESQDEIVIAQVRSVLRQP